LLRAMIFRANVSANAHNEKEVTPGIKSAGARSYSVDVVLRVRPKDVCHGWE